MAADGTMHYLQGRSLAFNLAGSSGALANGVFMTSTNPNQLVHVARGNSCLTQTFATKDMGAWGDDGVRKNIKADGALLIFNNSVRGLIVSMNIVC